METKTKVLLAQHAAKEREEEENKAKKELAQKEEARKKEAENKALFEAAKKVAQETLNYMKQSNSKPTFTASEKEVFLPTQSSRKQKKGPLHGEPPCKSRKTRASNQTLNLKEPIDAEGKKKILLISCYFI